VARTKGFDEREALRKILSLFWEKGYFQSSMEDILKAGGISKQSIYDTYGNKKDLFLKTLVLYREETVALIEDQVKQRLAKGGSTLDIIHDLVFHQDGRGCLAINSMLEFRDTDADVKCEIDSLLAFTKEIIKALISVGQERGEITSLMSGEHITEVLMNARTGFQVGQDYKMSPEELNNIANWTIDLIRAR
jgi:TetR/AcrR family transcriptional repressor of nem operon